jgi:hypothetical protein
MVVGFSRRPNFGERLCSYQLDWCFARDISRLLSKWHHRPLPISRSEKALT